MKKIFSLGIILLTIVYAFPLAYHTYYGQLETGLYQDFVPVMNGGGSIILPDETDAEPVQSVFSPDKITLPSGETDTEILVSVGGEVRTMNLEEYVAGVVAAEISPSFPEDAIRAQAVAARTYAVYKMRAGADASDVHNGAHVCDDYRHCTAYIELAQEASARWGSNASKYTSVISQAVADTAGEIVVTSDGEPIVAVFSAAAGAKTEAAADVWGSDISYLQSVSSPGGEQCSKYVGEVTLSLDDFKSRVSKTFPSADLSGPTADWFKASERSEAGGIKTVQLGGIRIEGTAIRELCALNSTNFTVSFTDDSITFHTVGYGHGVGLSQYGAKYMAERGSTYEQILLHYYTGTSIAKI